MSQWYLGYGSNLNRETFLGRRAIRPLREEHVTVDGWFLTFDIAGVPYGEPAFGSIQQVTEHAPTLQGMAYLVTQKDFDHIIATEGGSISYKQIHVEGKTDAGELLELTTLQARHPRRHCQPSQRYLGLIQQGARQHDFPKGYQHYLDSLEPFRLHGKKQKLGAAIFLGFWLPIIMAIFGIQELLSKAGLPVPSFLPAFAGICFKMMWWIHDRIWADRFGRGDHNEGYDLRVALALHAAV
ncbi:hypothetical protein BCR37DRAFT_104712 [Protomyces lactucae-debilis]|uniref:gamma-glutamylcyclotransferase n=1 Tax=Protomyces lactucae-debilis TaxID=2754530 RepID=A0A1Y2F3Q9_PROLT|nr:uncharacterized protein BCR37DRAFT_104712 [Protomyces lactucae-debilis]ORY78499.1 hypothetical protein BCR37DRAFT_104712 [Protomyces lactucae-debilis]